MSIMDFFRTSPTPPAQQSVNQSAQGATATVQADPLTAQSNATNPTVPVDQSNSPEAQLEAFKDLWKQDANAAAPMSPLGTLNQKGIQEAAGKLDFTRVIPKEALSKIAAGGEEAQAAFAQSLNSVAQAVFANSTTANAKIVEAALDNQRKQFMSELPQMLKQHGLGEALATQNPLLSHPAAQPMVEAIKNQMVQKFPNASQPELMQMVGQYMDQMAGLFKPKTEGEATKAQAAAGEDWTKFLM